MKVLQEVCGHVGLKDMYAFHETFEVPLYPSVCV